MHGGGRINEFFCVQEFIPRHIYELSGEPAERFISPRIIHFATELRKHINRPLTANNWHIGGPYQYRGYRDPDCKEGAPRSKHRLGMALDISVSGMYARELFDLILSKRDDLWPYVTRMENYEYTPTWVHVDLWPTGQKDVLIVDP